VEEEVLEEVPKWGARARSTEDLCGPTCRFHIIRAVMMHETMSLFSLQKANPKSATVPITSNLTAYAWSTKYRRKKKLIAQFGCKSRDKSFEPN